MTLPSSNNTNRMTNIDWKRVAGGCPVCKSRIQYHTLTAWCLKCGWAMNWTNESPKGTDGYDPVNEGVPTQGMPVVAKDSADLRLLDLALSYALDTQAIHMNDVAKINRLREMHVRVLNWLRGDE